MILNSRQTWRQHLAPLIRRIVATCDASDPRIVRRSLRAARPEWLSSYGYRVWCDEIRIALGQRPPRRGWGVGWRSRLDSLPGQRVLPGVPSEALPSRRRR